MGSYRVIVSIQVLTAFLYDKCESRKFLHTVMMQYATICFLTGQCFKNVLCVCQPEKCFMPLITETFKCSHFRLVHASTLLVSSTCKYKNISSPMSSSSSQKSLLSD